MIRFVVICGLATIFTNAAPRETRVRPVIPLLDGKIVGGHDTTIEEYPYQLSLQYYDTHSCGASIITETVALSAAHCTDTSPLVVSDYKVRAGSSQHNSGGQIYQLLEIHNHPRYDDMTTDFDISILILQTPLVFGVGIQPIRLANLEEELPEGTLATVTGWGTTSSGGSSPIQLQTVDVPKVSYRQCEIAYQYSRITDRMICFGFPEGGKDTCQNDSGGPLVFKGVQYGVVSWGLGCALPNIPGIYAKVSHRDILPFIKSFL